MPELADDEGFRYLVVDEIVGSSVGLALAGWPQVDEQGRIRFGQEPARLLGADRHRLEAFLSQHRLPREQADRPARIGDVFAVRLIPGALLEVADELEEQKRMEPLLAPEAWIRPPVYDLTAPGREAAKTAYYSAVAPTLDPEQAAELREQG